MKIRSFFVAALVLTCSLAQAETAPSTQRRVNAAPSSQLSQADAEKAFGVLFQANVTQQFPAAEYAKIKDIMCNLDKIEMVKGDKIDIDGATHCTFKKESGEEVQISGPEAVKLKEVLENNDCEVEESNAYSLIKAKEMELNLDRLQQSLSGSIKK